jgi:diguanylate cyclase (GGDEF)-like protein
MGVRPQPAGEATRAGGAEHGDGDETVWRRHLFMGIGAFTLGAALLLGYLALTPHGPHRGVLIAVDLSGAGSWLFIFAPVGTRAIRTKWRVPFFALWTVTTLAFIAAGAGLDGGIESPITVLLVLPVLFAALVYPLTTVIVLAVVAEVFYALVAATGTVVSLSRVTMTGLALGLAGGIAIMAAINRSAQENDRQRLTDRLHRLATRDGLTGCLTYQAFQEALEREATRARRYGRPFSVVMVDLDSFKDINDAHGHAVGDATLRCIAQALLSAARTTDLVGRLGGDEFAALLPETDTSQAPVVAERFLANARSAKTPVTVTISLGTATWSNPLDTPDEVMRRADQALYAAKHDGRDRLVVWEAECRVRLRATTVPSAGSDL